ncbi:hypothetical protein SLS62_009197 [Diatrype stigma]|uniref:Uncharacterized protein n=1 Tax=Diatrype stigma TaxID=117547 RepID=A0AAN9UG77_9PEZI
MRLSLMIAAVAAIVPAAVSVKQPPHHYNVPDWAPEWNITKYLIGIPVEEALVDVQCTGSALNPNDTAIAKAQAIAWSELHRIGWKDMKYWGWGKSVLWVCNCGLPGNAPLLSEKEFNRFEQALMRKCGPNQSGWLWSAKQKRGYNLGVNSPGRKNCPFMCLLPKNQ